MSLRRLFWLIAFWLTAAAIALLSAAPPKAGPSHIRIPVWVESANSGTVKAADMSATLEGSSSRVVGVKGPGDDLMLLVVLDLVDDLTLNAVAKQALMEQIGRLPASTYVGLMRAQDGLKVLADPSPDRAPVLEAVQNLPVSGKAGLLDTVEASGRIADAILNKASVRVAVLYVTDSEVQNYREDFTNPVINSSDSHDLSRRFPEALVQEKISKLKGSLAGQQAPLFVVHLRYRSDRLNEAYQIGLKQLAETTAGTSIFCRSTAEVPDAIRSILETISTHYSVTVALPERLPKTVQVQLTASGAEGENLALSYRTRLAIREK